jgi:hypothetical protein
LDSDAGLVDLFLHACDVPLDALQLDALLTRAGLVTRARLPRARDGGLPAAAHAPHLHTLWPRLTEAQRGLVSELLTGQHTRHTVLAMRPALRPDDYDSSLLPAAPASFAAALAAGTVWEWVLVPMYVYPEDLARACHPVPDTPDAWRWARASASVLPLAATALALLRRLDGTRTLEYVWQSGAAGVARGRDEFVHDVRCVWEMFEPAGRLVASLTPFPDLWEHSYM